MSGKIRLETAARLKTAGLAERLRSIGISVPDQTEARRMKDAMELGLPLDTPRRHITWAVFRKCKVFFNDGFYRIFSWDSFEAYDYKNNGGAAPKPVRDTVEKIRLVLPGVTFDVHASYDDPWLVAMEGNESVILHGWYRTDRYATPVQIL